MIQEIDCERNILHIKEEGSNSKTIIFKLKENIRFDVFRREQRGLVIGEEIRWTRNDKQHNIINSHTGIIENITRNKIHIHSDNRIIKLDKNHLSIKHLDYAYASTIHASQGKTTDHVIGVLESKHQYLTTQKSFYVTISRTRYEATIITDNAVQLIRHLYNHTGIQGVEHQQIDLKLDKNYTKQDAFQM